MTDQKHANSKTVTIYRAGSYLARAQGKEIEDHFAMAKTSIGSYFENKNSQRIASGLSYDEEKLLMPDLVTVPLDDRDFRAKVKEFFQEIDTKIPHNTGLVLEIGLESSNDLPVSKTNRPIVLIDYVRYRHALGHPWVAANKDTSEGNPNKQFYIFDKTLIDTRNTEKTKKKDAAIQIYFQIRDNEQKVDMMLTLLGDDPRRFTGDNAADLKVEELRSRAETDPSGFATIYNEGDMEIRFWIRSMLNSKILKQIGLKFQDVESGRILGNGLEELIFWFKDDEHSDEVVVLKTKMQEALRAPAITAKRKTQALAGKTLTKS